jgi:NAD-dependent dihydropyrimidine dehydrogenase PreA subunit
MGRTGNKRDPAKESYWRQQVRLWEQSNLTVPTFCAQHGLKVRSFYQWKRTLAERDCPVPAEAPAPAELALFALPQLDETRCTGCGECVVVCPAECLEMAGPLPWLPRPGDCVSCALCAAICPAEAIAMSSGPASPRVATRGLSDS